MTKQDYIEQLYFRLGTNDQAGKHPKQLIEVYLDMAWNQILHDTFRKDISSLDFYGKWYDVVTPALTTSGRYSVALPAPIVQLPNISEGVRKIKFDLSADDAMYTFRPISEEDYYFSKSLQNTEAYINNIDYIVSYNRIEFGDGYDNSTMSGKTLNVLIVRPFKSYDWTEELPIPSGQQVSFFNIATEYAIGTPPVNLSNRNE